MQFTARMRSRADRGTWNVHVSNGMTLCGTVVPVGMNNFCTHASCVQGHAFVYCMLAEATSAKKLPLNGHVYDTPLGSARRDWTFNDFGSHKFRINKRQVFCLFYFICCLTKF